ncbi:hypothetical protein THAOC_31460 [Thalassiosira oceanica]|uniref:Uncharacterized protein n=1 Tax=Thalassiosira oceanica TaxID=159749 RepID=K0RLA2_THAOC|nr:hypothetical protein THAOC_31460 [Thalassiosira oceanica]|eukprot:EJK49641.1 hypothetical protein THAOC_31460 [Thalassiosira oceanica]
MPGAGKTAKSDAQWAREFYDCVRRGAKLVLKNPKRGRPHEEYNRILCAQSMATGRRLNRRSTPSEHRRQVDALAAGTTAKANGTSVSYCQLCSERRRRPSHLAPPAPHPGGSSCPTASQ